MRSLLLLTLCASFALPQAGELVEGELNGQSIVFRVVDGLAMYQEDIILGPATKPSGQRNTSFFIGNLWPDGLVPYEVDPVIPANTVVQLQRAIDTWNSYGTPIKLQPRAGEPDYVRIVRSTANAGVCSSAVGRRGGMQSIFLEDICTTPSIIHEIGHTVGMWHEQSRIDRNLNVTVLYENIAKDRANNYNIEAFGQDIGGYEYGSSMHYRPFSFSVDGRQAMESVPPGIPMGDAPGMNPGDLDAVSRKYGMIPTLTTIATNPPGLTILVDGEAIVTPRAFSWVAGSQHTLSVPDDPQVVGGVQYTHGKWTDGGAQSHSITAGPDVTVFTANFIRRLPVTLGQSTGGTVSVNPPSPDGYYPTYTDVKVTAQPDPGYRFLRWQPAGFSCNPTTTSANPIKLAPRTTGYGCSAIFTQAAITTIDSDPPGQIVSVDGLSYQTPIDFTFAPGSSHTISASSVGGAVSRLRFDGWSDGGAPSHAYLALAEGGTVTARYTRQYLLTVQQPGTLIGTVQTSPASLDGFYDAGTVVQLQVNLNTPFLLFSWTGDLYGRDNPATLVMDDQKLVAGRVAISSLPAITVLNSLTFQSAAISPGQIVSIFGENIGPPGGASAVLDGNGRVASETGRTRILFDGIPAPITFASANQVNAVVPYGVAGRPQVQVVAEYEGVQKPGVVVPITSVNPSIVSNGAGAAVVVNEDGSINSAERPARRGSVIVFYATGEGVTTPDGIDGRVGAAPLARPVREVSVRVGGRMASLVYAGSAPGFVAGAMQVNARIPDDAPAGFVSLYLIVGTTSSPALTKIYVQ